MDKVEREYRRIMDLFKDSDAQTLALMDGLIWEAARTRVRLDELDNIAKKSGLVKTHPNIPTMQKEMPVARVLPKVEASYTNMMFKLSKALKNDVDEEDLGLKDYE